MDSWIKLYRKITENPLYFSEVFTRLQAWIDLLIIANNDESYIYVRGNKVEIKRGQNWQNARHFGRTLEVVARKGCALFG